MTDPEPDWLTGLRRKADILGDEWTGHLPLLLALYDDREAALRRAQERIRCWRDGVEPPALEDDDAIGPPDIRELIEAAPRFRGERADGGALCFVNDYEAIVSRSEIVAYGRALAWQDARIGELEAERDKLVRTLTLAKVLIQEGREVCAVDEIRATLREIGGDRG